MKTLIEENNCLVIKKINEHYANPICVDDVMEEHGVEWHEIGCVDWEKEYPYCPLVSFRIVHTGEAILVEYKVEEETIRAVAEDKGNVWEDSCCEMFLSLPNEKTYYNFECNCAGKLLIEHGAGRGVRERASKEVLLRVLRWSSNGDVCFDEKPSNGIWKMALIIPVDCFFKDNLETLSGLRMRGNFYKCGDKLSKPHFLSWQRILTETPDFHRPEYFGDLFFE